MQKMNIYNGKASELIFTAMKNNNLEEIKKLSHLINIENLNGEYSRILTRALMCDNFDIYNYLLTILDIDEIIPNLNVTLWAHVMENSLLGVDELDVILANSKNINLKDELEGNTILHRMINIMTSRIVFSELYMHYIELLLKHGADPCIENRNGNSSIDLSFQCDIQLLDMLLNRSSKKYITQKTLFRAISYNYGDKYDKIELLLRHVERIDKLLINLGNNQLYTPSEFAKLFIPKETDIIELLEFNTIF